MLWAILHPLGKNTFHANHYRFLNKGHNKASVHRTNHSTNQIFQIIQVKLFCIILGTPVWKTYQTDLETTIGNLFDWFCYNNLQVNPAKCHSISSPFSLKFINIKSSSTEGSSKKKFLGGKVDSNFTFEKRKQIMLKRKQKVICPYTMC